MVVLSVPPPTTKCLAMLFWSLSTICPLPFLSAKFFLHCPKPQDSSANVESSLAWCSCSFHLPSHGEDGASLTKKTRHPSSATRYAQQRGTGRQARKFFLHRLAHLLHLKMWSPLRTQRDHCVSLSVHPKTNQTLPPRLPHRQGETPVVPSLTSICCGLCNWKHRKDTRASRAPLDPRCCERS